MRPEKGTPEEPFKKNSAKSNEGLEGVIEELRQVLAGLGKDKPSEEVLPPMEESPLDFSEPPSAEISEPSAPSLTKDAGPLKDTAPSEQASDADFWNGNVLGWTEGSSEAFEQPANAATPPSTPPPPPPVTPKQEPQRPAFGDEWLREPAAFEPPPPPVKKPAPFQPVEPSLPNDFVNPVPTFRSPEPPRQAPPARPPEPPRSPEATRPFEKPKSFSFDDFPPAPLSPFEQDHQNTIQPEPAFNESPMAFRPPPMEEPLAPSVPEEKEDLSLIPGSIDNSKPAAPLPASTVEKENLDLDSMSLKPEGLIQIACVFPKGFEKMGQQFVSTLRGSAEKSKTPLAIQPVFIHPWAGQVDVSAWGRSATLAGADVMFVLVEKNDQARFTAFAKEAQAVGIDARLVLIEQVGLRALYADILVKLRRKK